MVMFHSPESPPLHKGSGFIVGDEEFLKFLYIVARGVLTPFFYEDPAPPPILPTPLTHFSKLIKWIYKCRALVP